MFFLELDFNSILLASVLGMILALLAFAVILGVMHACGIRLLWNKRSAAKSRDKENEDANTENAALNGELSEEELIVLLTAAAMEALNAGDTKRFRVVAFRRI